MWSFGAQTSPSVPSRATDQTRPSLLSLVTKRPSTSPMIYTILPSKLASHSITTHLSSKKSFQVMIVILSIHNVYSVLTSKAVATVKADQHVHRCICVPFPSPAAPRPNVFVYVSPLHINVDQRSCLWLVEFVYGVVKTINMELAVSVHDEGKSYMVSVL